MIRKAIGGSEATCANSLFALPEEGKPAALMPRLLE